jgi:hypothetical protein
MAGSPERPAVLRRLGIVKDTDDAPFLRESRAPLQQEDPLELFAAEHESSPRFGGVRKSLRIAGVAATALLRRSALLGVIAVFAIGIVGGVWLINRMFGQAPSTTETTETESGTAPAAKSGTPAAESGTAPSSRAASKTPADVFLPAGRRANAARLSADAVPRGQQTVQTRSQNTPLAAAQSDRADGGAELQVPFAAVPSSADAAATVIDETIYSAEDQGVLPPQTSEKLPGPTISRWTTRTNAMEVIVSETGAVERVRLVTPPQRMPDIQVLSVAKVWKFKPAMKDGKPVRYRLLVTWEVNP